MLLLLAIFILVLFGSGYLRLVRKKILMAMKKIGFKRLISIFFLFLCKIRAVNPLLLIRYIISFMTMWYAMNNEMHNKKIYDKKETDLDEKEALHILGLSLGASRQEIESAFKKLMMQHHPDHGGSRYFTEKILQARNTLIPKGERNAKK